MDKFSKIQRLEKINKNNSIDTNNYAYEGNYLKIRKENDYEWVEEKDMVVILPYIKDEGMILLRYEPITAFQDKYKNTEWRNKTHYITSICGGIEENETPLQAVKRELYEEAGLLLSELYNIEIQGPFFVSKGSSAQYYTCLMEINYNDYKFTMAPGDGSQKEKESKTIKVSLGEIDDIIASDMVTRYMLTKLKKEYNI